jgi:hypothetical protein
MRRSDGETRVGEAGSIPSEVVMRKLPALIAATTVLAAGSAPAGLGSAAGTTGRGSGQRGGRRAADVPGDPADVVPRVRR